MMTWIIPWNIYRYALSVHYLLRFSATKSRIDCSCLNTGSALEDLTWCHLVDASWDINTTLSHCCYSWQDIHKTISTCANIWNYELSLIMSAIEIYFIPKSPIKGCENIITSVLEAFALVMASSHVCLLSFIESIVKENLW